MTASLLFISLALAAPVPKAPPPELKWRFAKGDSYYIQYEQEATSQVNAGGGGGAQGATNTTSMIFKVSVTSAGDRETVVEWECVSYRQEAKAGGGAIVAPNAGNKDVSGKVVKYTLDGKQKVTKVDGAEELAKAVGAGGFEMMSEDGLRHVMDQLLHSVPGKALTKGDKWNGEIEGSLMHGLTTKKTTRGTVAEIADGIAKLAVESDHEWSGTANPGNGGGGISVGYSLKGEKGPGTVEFDMRKGRLKKIEETMPLSGTVSIGGAGAAGGQQIDISVSMKTTITVTDEKPKKE